MSVVQKISTSSAVENARLLFVHGLGGHIRDTWRGNGDAFWPEWLAEDVPETGVYSAGYEASPTAWLGASMPLADRATELLTQLDADGFADQPLIFLGHSLGGLLIKEMLRIGRTQRQPAWCAIAEKARGVVFISTPHAGSRLANYVNALGVVSRASVSVAELQANSSYLRQLNYWYRNNARRYGIATHVFYEKQNSKGVRVVDELSADPGMEAVHPIPLDAQHIDICKPDERTELVYRSSLRFIQTVLRKRAGGICEKAGISKKPVHKRFNFSLSPLSARKLAQIRKQIDADSNSEVFRRAINLYDRFLSGEFQPTSNENKIGVVFDD